MADAMELKREATGETLTGSLMKFAMSSVGSKIVMAITGLGLWLFVMPVTAIAVYAPVAVWGWNLPTNWIFYVITMPLGFFFFIRSLWLLHRPQRGQEPKA